MPNVSIYSRVMSLKSGMDFLSVDIQQTEQQEQSLELYGWRMENNITFYIWRKKILFFLLATTVTTYCISNAYYFLTKGACRYYTAISISMLAIMKNRKLYWYYIKSKSKRILNIFLNRDEDQKDKQIDKKNQFNSFWLQKGLKNSCLSIIPNKLCPVLMLDCIFCSSLCIYFLIWHLREIACLKSTIVSTKLFLKQFSLGMKQALLKLNTKHMQHFLWELSIDTWGMSLSTEN